MIESFALAHNSIFQTPTGKPIKARRVIGRAPITRSALPLVEKNWAGLPLAGGGNWIGFIDIVTAWAFQIESDEYNI